MDYLVSDTLKGMLDRDRMRGTTAPTVGLHGIGDGERTGKSALSHQPAREGGEPRPMTLRLVSSRQSARRSARKPCLVLVWSDGHAITQAMRSAQP